MRVIVGMSGGIDSSVTAYLLKEQGYEVEGLSFVLYEARLRNAFSGCCSVEAINDAQRTAERIGVRHSRLDLRSEFTEKVIEPFIEAYSRGLTPNPCILCNRHIKFPHLLTFADERSADCIATGHYARVKEGEGSRVRGNELRAAGEDNSSLLTHHSSRLLKGIDPRKDQSYVLYVLRQEDLRRLLLPLGEKRKDEVRQIARALDLPAAKRPESQEICFIEDRKYFRFLDNLAERRAGPIIDIASGKIMGTHKGIHLFTIGQRKRLGIATGKPLFVAGIDRSKNAVFVGPKEAAMMREFVVEEINWIDPSRSPLRLTPSRLVGTPPLKISRYDSARGLRGSYDARGDEKGTTTFRASVKVRSMMKDEPAVLAILEDGRVKVVFDEPQWAPAPGQSAVFYDGDVVIGGGVISASTPAQD